MNYLTRFQWRGGTHLPVLAVYSDPVCAVASVQHFPNAANHFFITGHYRFRPRAHGHSHNPYKQECVGNTQSNGKRNRDAVTLQVRINKNNRADYESDSTADTEYTQVDVGVNYWLHPNVVFKFDYQDQDAAPGRKELDGWNLGVGYMF